MDAPIMDVVVLLFAMPGIFMLLAFLGLFSAYIIISLKTWISGVFLGISGLAYLISGLYFLFSFQSTSITMLSFILVVIGIGQIGFGIDLFVIQRKKLKRASME